MNVQPENLCYKKNTAQPIFLWDWPRFSSQNLSNSTLFSIIALAAFICSFKSIQVLGHWQIAKIEEAYNLFNLFMTFKMMRFTIRILFKFSTYSQQSLFAGGGGGFKTPLHVNEYLLLPKQHVPKMCLINLISYLSRIWMVIFKF